MTAGLLKYSCRMDEQSSSDEDATTNVMIAVNKRKPKNIDARNETLEYGNVQCQKSMTTKQACF